MSDLFLLSEGQMARISPFFPLSHGVPRVDDRRVISRIIYVIRNGLQWKDAPKAYGPHKTLYNRFVRWSLAGVFDRIFVALSPDPSLTLLAISILLIGAWCALAVWFWGIAPNRSATCWPGPHLCWL
jgi:transposase